MKSSTAHSNSTGTMSFYLAIPKDLAGIARPRLKRLLGIAMRQRDQAQDVGWPALEASWQADVDRIQAAIAAAS